MTANILLVIDVFAAISLIVLVLLQQGKGSDWMASQYSRGPVNSPTMNNNQFRAMNKSSQLVDNSNFTGKNMANNAKLIIAITKVKI